MSGGWTNAGKTGQEIDERIIKSTPKIIARECLRKPGAWIDESEHWVEYHSIANGLGISASDPYRAVIDKVLSDPLLKKTSGKTSIRIPREMPGLLES